ncbi:hypothetical protein GSI_07389 [Ganoderma sinense ZZ0214-1]|uniref:Uncharacterized protein n=1 Tax=Ganoderma sinense ZZ0214-1 TaxID=1077348 RepID=A0A2G8SA98_9APHY|nr:hypothetical protein GSI_07389 [Ganoderma sinense ZZ0214-1]
MSSGTPVLRPIRDFLRLPHQRESVLQLCSGVQRECVRPRVHPLRPALVRPCDRAQRHRQLRDRALSRSEPVHSCVRHELLVWVRRRPELSTREEQRDIIRRGLASVRHPHREGI